MSAIIVEGPDGSGKSTLIEILTARFAVLNFIHHGAYLEERNIYPKYMMPILDARRHEREMGTRTTYVNGARLQFDVSLLMDRSWLAEPIYGAVMRGGENRINDVQRAALDAMFTGIRSTTTILCLPPFETCFDNWSARREREYPDSREKLHAIWEAYATAGQMWSDNYHNVIVHNYVVDPQADGVCAYLQQH